MRFTTRLVFCLFAAACGSSSTTPSWESVGDVRRAANEFDLEYVVEFRGDHLHVDGALVGDDDGETVLLLPSDWAGERELYRELTNFVVATPDTRTLPDPQRPERVVVRHFPGARLRFRYELRPKPRRSVVTSRFRPILRDDFFHAVGHAMFVQPDWPAAKEIDVAFHWRKFPSSWTITNSWSHAEPDQAIRIPLADLRHALYLAGEYRMTRLEIEKHPVWVAVAGNWPFEDEQFVSAIEKIVAQERSFWDDHAFPHYLIALLPGGAQCCTFAGTGLTNAFTTVVSADRWRHEEMVFLLAHELFHTWNGGKIVPEPGQGRGLFWFSEGFTSYYTWVMNLRAGLIDLDQYVRQYNEDIASYWLSPVRDVPNERIDSEFWSDPDVQRLPYYRGAILAHRWDTEIRTRTKGKKSLDDFMRKLLAERRGVTPALLADKARPLLGRDPTADIDDHMIGGQALEPGPGDLGPCVKLRERPVGFFELGFDLGASDRGGRIAGVREGSAAWEAGLRDGQEVLAWDIRISKPFPRENVLVLVREGEQERQIRYFPMGPAQPVPQYELDREAWERDPTACLRWFD